MGIELQLEELVERRARATAQGRSEEAQELSDAIAALVDELATAAADALEQPSASVRIP